MIEKDKKPQEKLKKKINSRKTVRSKQAIIKKEHEIEV